MRRTTIPLPTASTLEKNFKTRLHRSLVNVQNEYDPGNPFYLDTEKGCNSADASRCANELVHELTEIKKRSGRQSAAPS